MNFLKNWDKEVFEILEKEKERLKEWINLIPSENYTYPEVFEIIWSVFNDKYAEWYPWKRYYWWCENADALETLAQERAKKVFWAEHINIQCLSWSIMNQAVYYAFMKPWDTILGMDLSHWGHLTHWHPITHMWKLFNFVRYKTDLNNNWKINFEELLEIAKKTKPKIVLCGYTSYPRDYDYTDFKKVADEVWAITMADISHIWWLVAWKAMKNPFDYWFDIVTTTTHKTLRWPRWWMIMCKKEFAKKIDRSVFPKLQWWPFIHNIWWHAVALKKAWEPEYETYASQVLKNSKKLAETLINNWAKLITDWTDNHMMVLDVEKSFWYNWTKAEEILGKAWIYVNKQVIPDDLNPPLNPSWIRIWTPAVTTRWMKENKKQVIWDLIIKALKSDFNEEKLAEIKLEITKLWKKFKIPTLEYKI